MGIEGPFIVAGIPESVAESEAAVCRSRLLTAIRELASHSNDSELLLLVGTPGALRRHCGVEPKQSSSAVAEQAGGRYEAREPLYSFSQLVLPDDTLSDLLAVVNTVEVEALVFDSWGLRRIEPFPRAALNFHGKPGTGKTMAAHALADRIRRPILAASYAEIESKYHGDGPKNVKALFAAAENADAVLFIDEADSLLSKRLENVTQGSEQAINSMRSQLLICLEQYRGVVVFSTNFVKAYDRAFETRVRNIEFPMPTANGRRDIWRRHLLPSLPQASDVDALWLAENVDDVCGRDIKNAVIDAAVRVAIDKRAEVSRADLVAAIERIKRSRVVEARSLTSEETSTAESRLRQSLRAAHDRDGSITNATTA